MARIQQSLTGRAHDVIRGLGISEPEYTEAQEILKQISLVGNVGN
jgi:hypothetical protein